jgi:hypothetical protein
MALDYLLWTGDAAKAQPYLKIAFQVANFFMYHFTGGSAPAEKIVIAPAQVLEVRSPAVYGRAFVCDE